MQNSTTGASNGSIAPNHLDILAASGITPEHAAARGYETVTDKHKLVELGISAARRSVPGLLVPMLDVRGSTWGYQYKPDNPRKDRKGNSRKYETPVGQRNGIDVPPGAATHLGNPGEPLWITEGIKKADCAVLQGLCCVSIPGVWSWRGKNASGGTTAVGDFNDIALNDRRVIQQIAPVQIRTLAGVFCCLSLSRVHPLRVVPVRPAGEVLIPKCANSVDDSR
jgi:hypothetical protein